ncbi:hypothetical protein MRS44_017657 [Fusarium solani]|uniref:uncharacterized protein n=1 Tax=Fusarium solani TaxID=169388 RepID=UPI0032C47CD5|nr:hypothetical protein MRS44_017657 [Fusarium solani]
MSPQTFNDGQRLVEEQVDLEAALPDKKHRKYSRGLCYRLIPTVAQDHSHDAYHHTSHNGSESCHKPQPACRIFLAAQHQAFPRMTAKSDVTLSRPSEWTAWYDDFVSRAETSKIFDFVDIDKDAPILEEPKEPISSEEMLELLNKAAYEAWTHANQQNAAAAGPRPEPATDLTDGQWTRLTRLQSEYKVKLATFANRQRAYAELAVWDRLKPRRQRMAISRVPPPPRMDSSEIWHLRSCHAGPQALEQLVLQTKGVRIKGPTTVQCTACGTGKATEIISRRESSDRSRQPFYRTFIDIFEFPAAFNGHRYVLLMTDEFSGMMFSWSLASKTDVSKIIKDFEARVKRHTGASICKIRIDNERAIINLPFQRDSEFQIWATEVGIEIELPPSHTKEPTGGAERPGGINQLRMRSEGTSGCHSRRKWTAGFTSTFDGIDRQMSISMLPRLSDTLKRRRRILSDRANIANGHPLIPCKRNCYQTSTTSAVNSAQRPWTPEEHIVMRSTVATADHSRVKTDPFCIVAHLLDRDCRDVFHEYEHFGIRLPPPEPVRKTPIRTVSWYDRFKKALIGDWENRTRSQEHQQRELIEPCSHEGPCTLENCICVQYGYLCEKYCGCTVENCAYKFTGCACHSQGKTCLSKQKDRQCVCVQLSRECDPDLCGTCGVLERADPENAEDELLHATGCQNCSLQRGLTRALALGQSQLEGVGYGLFAAELIAQGDFIIEYVGELITHDEGVRREARRGDVFNEESNISYVFTLLENEGIWVDAAIYGNLSRYINHASEKSDGDKRGCNITPRILYVNGEYRIKFTATRDIQAGEELFFNYGENFPNLTKKLLDHKAGEMSDEAKKRTRRPNRADNGQGVARKAPKSDKKNSGKGKEALRQDLEDEDSEMYESPEFIPKLPRKRKQEVQDDSEEDEYHPTATDATGSCGGSPSATDSDFALGKGSDRLRKRARQPLKSAMAEYMDKSRGEPKTRGKRGGARPGSGRPRKYPHRAPKPAPAPMPEQSVAMTPDRPRTETPEVIQPPGTALGLQRPQAMGIDDSLEDIEHSGEFRGNSMSRGRMDDDDDDDDDQDVFIRKRDRGMRNRRPPVKSRDDGAWLSGS